MKTQTLSKTGRVYIAGGMRGYVNHNFPAFDEAAATLSRKGWDVVNPADLDRKEFGYTGAEEVDNTLVKHMLIRDLQELVDCTAIALLPGWGTSKGARMEATVAATLGLEMYIYVPATGSLLKRTPEYMLKFLKGQGN